MSSSINSSQQLRYMVQWFSEWSELQRSDFLPILADNYAHRAYVNGIVNSISNMDCRDKPMSLFECRIKLFKEWFTQWNIELKEAFLKKIGEIDEKFVEKLNAEIEEKAETLQNNEDGVNNGENEADNHIRVED
ncbi:unnamed protein product [Ceutorhynchus assimilis]|uniref:Uncharacterized protein n=1 Tax=Ceutorhynchus assimilis TaxID=467358 RepID=A0A9N9QN89_9CUCU|nr:unnamed protein product [Ceutorhynchus assimilis]